MKANIQPIPESVLEFGKAGTVVVTLIINPTEARRIREDFCLDDIPAMGSSPSHMAEILAAIEDGPEAIRLFNAAND